MSPLWATVSDRSPKVSVLMTTYRHENFIRRALDSVLEQQVDFDYRIVITEDGSDDATAAIVADYSRRHPDRIDAVCNETNRGSYPAAIQTWARATGEYYAFLDGDDYWDDPTKLQVEVEYLDRHPECVLVFHPVEVLAMDGASSILYPPRRKSRYTIRDLMQLPIMATSSVVARHIEGVHFPAWFDPDEGLPGDWALWLEHARHGDIGYIDRPMSVYRQHAGGIYTSQPDERAYRLSIYEIPRRVDAEMGYPYRWVIRRAVLALRIRILVVRYLPFLVRPLARLRAWVVDQIVRRR